MNDDAQAIIEDARLTILHVFSLLTACCGHDLTLEDSARILEAHDLIQGNQNDVSIPWEERTPRLSDRLPPVPAWCVMVNRTGGTYRPWPGMGFDTKEEADAWREFLEDYFFDVHVRDGRNSWVVEYTTTEAINFMRKSNKPIGHGYGYDRHGWVGTLPMRVYELDRKTGTWRKKK